MMNDPVWIVQLIVAAVFLYSGFSHVFAHRRQTAGLRNEGDCRCMGLPYPCSFLIGLVEIVAALALVVPVHLWGPDVLARSAAFVLSLLALAACVLQIRRKQPAEHFMALFLTVLLVIVGRWW